MNLPLKLGVEPLADAIFEVRFKAGLPASSLLPGIFFSSLPGPKRIDRLPQAEIPAPIRHSNPDLRYAPLVRVDWDRFYINIGDFSLGVACKMPYPGWSTFKPAIETIMRSWASAEIATAVERCSIKGTNVIDRKLGAPSEAVALLLKIGNRDLSSTLFQIRSEITQDSLIQVVLVAAEGVAELATGERRIGTVLDIDTILDMNDLKLDQFTSQMSETLDLVHLKNKEMFFSCLTPELLSKLEPSYG